MKTQSFKRVLLFSSLLFLLACKEDGSMPLKEYDNPYKEYGLVHNEVIRDVIKRNPNWVKFKPEQLKNEILSTTRNFYGEEIVQKSQIDLNDPFVKSLIESLNLSLEFVGTIDTLYIQSILSDAVKIEFYRFDAEMKDFFADNINSLSFSGLYNKMVEFEWSIVNKGTLTENDKAILLVFTAMVKESYRLWSEYNDSIGVNQRGWKEIFVCSVDALSGIAILLATQGMGAHPATLTLAQLMSLLAFIVANS